MDGRFLEAFTLLPRQREVCGRATKPLCLRHRLMLTAAKSPFVDGLSIPRPQDVIIFSRIVSTHDTAEMTASEPSKSDKEWMRQMCDDVEVLASQISEAMGCISDQSKWPVFWKKKSGKSNGVPWALSVVCNLVKNGVPLEEAWTMPESQAIWMNAAFAISSGADIDIVSDEDLAIQRFMEKIEAEKAAASEMAETETSNV